MTIRRIWEHQKEDVLKQIENLESNLGKKNFKKEYLKFFNQACNFLEIPDHIITLVTKSPDPYLKDGIIWAYMSYFALNRIFRNYKCFDINKKTIEKRYSNYSLWVEPLESFGTINFLPAKEIFSPFCSYVFINNHPYLLTLAKENHLAHEEDDFYSEQKWADKETAIFIALINLVTEYGWCSFFISDGGFYIPLEFYNFKFSDLSERNVKKLKELIELYEYVHQKTSEESQQKNKTFSYKRNLNIKNIDFLNKKISRKNSVLIRCLYYFAKACAFAPHRMMMEESTGLQLFCLDGLSKLFMQKFKLKKISDLDDFLKRKFGCPYGEYLKELYDERTIYVHPYNIHGEFWCPPWDADTCLDTLPVVRDLLLLYLTGKFEFTDKRWINSIKEMETE